MTQFVEKATNWAEEHQTRRGFMARAGKVALGLGLVMAGVSREPFLARAQGGCCPLPPCPAAATCHPGPWPLPVANACAAPCFSIGHAHCCNRATGTCDECHTCQCPAPALPCTCSYVTTMPCGGPGSPC